jgi:predicted P-loop ATPase
MYKRIKRNFLTISFQSSTNKIGKRVNNILKNIVMLVIRKNNRYHPANEYLVGCAHNSKQACKGIQ